MKIDSGSWFWRHVQKGGLESIGWDIQTLTSAERSLARKNGATGFSSHFKSNGFLGWRAAQEAFTLKRAAGAGLGRASLSAVGKAAVPLIGLATTAYQMYEGYQQEGIWGAVKGGAEGAAYGIGFSMALSAGATMGTLAGAAIAGAGVYTVGTLAKEKSKRIRGLELAAVGADILQSQGAVTERQRAAEALQNTRINARMALGNEASLFHTRYR